MGLSPAEFWDMTPAEFAWAWEGYHRRLRDQLRQTAWAVAHQVNVWAKDPVTPAELLGEAKAAPMITSKADFKAAMRKQQAEIRQRRKGKGDGRA